MQLVDHNIIIIAPLYLQILWRYTNAVIIIIIICLPPVWNTMMMTVWMLSVVWCVQYRCRVGSVGR